MKPLEGAPPSLRYQLHRLEILQQLVFSVLERATTAAFRFRSLPATPECVDEQQYYNISF